MKKEEKIMKRIKLWKAKGRTIKKRLNKKMKLRKVKRRKIKEKR